MPKYDEHRNFSAFSAFKHDIFWYLQTPKVKFWSIISGTHPSSKNAKKHPSAFFFRLLLVSGTQALGIGQLQINDSCLFCSVKEALLQNQLCLGLLLAPDSTRNRTTSRCPFWAAMKRGVAPSSVVPCSLLAPDSTRNRTTPRCPWWAAM